MFIVSDIFHSKICLKNEGLGDLWRVPCNADTAAALARHFSCLVGRSSKTKVKDPCLHRLVLYFLCIKHARAVVPRVSDGVYMTMKEFSLVAGRTRVVRRLPRSTFLSKTVST